MSAPPPREEPYQIPGGPPASTRHGTEADGKVQQPPPPQRAAEASSRPWEYRPKTFKPSYLGHSSASLRPYHGVAQENIAPGANHQKQPEYQHSRPSTASHYKTPADTRPLEASNAPAGSRSTLPTSASVPLGPDPQAWSTLFSRGNQQPITAYKPNSAYWSKGSALAGSSGGVPVSVPVNNYSRPDYIQDLGGTYASNYGRGASNPQDLVDLLADIPDHDPDLVREHQPPEMTITLLPHQLEGVAWLKSREESTNAGGILADDMGLGKTIQTISLILANRSKDAKCKSTLVVAPLALIKQWELEVQTRTKKGSLSVLVYHGPSRPKDIAKLRATDVVITTYQVVASEYPDGLLYKNKWFRVVLDEAQTIKNKKTKSAIGCCALEADRRFCLSGTPLQNNIDEFYSFLKFLRFRPFHDYAMFKRQISEPMSRGRSVLAYNRLRAIFQVIMLRRTKASKIDGKPLLQLPARNVNIEKVSLGPDELEFYTTLETRIKSTLKGFQQDGYGKNFTNILVLLLRLRQACDHRQLVGLGVDKEGEVQPDKGADLDDDVDEMMSLFKTLEVEQTKRQCSICFEPIQDAPAGQKECNTCAKTLERTWDGKVKTEEADAKWVSSAKVDKMMAIIDDWKLTNPLDKIIIFSQFTSMLNIVEKPLKRKGYKFCRYDGSMKNAHREEALERLRSDPETKILLISLKCGSLGLNLTAANRVIMLDMWWNPALEDQAIDRVHRIGQTKDVEVIRLAVENTVEDRILALQERKRTMIESALGNTKGKKNQKLSVNELLQLFG